jgi:5-methylcytosine-specific restriction endonuclease McrA
MTIRRGGLARGGRRVGLTVRLLRARDGDGCGRCGDLIDFDQDGNQPAGPTIGHVVPAARGGSDAMLNLRLEHSRCNKRAGARPEQPRALIAAPPRREWIPKALDHSAR